MTEMSIVNLDMPIDVVDTADHVIGVLSRRKVFEVGANFRVVHVLIFNSMGDLLIQKLSTSRERNPGFWGSSVAGYVFASESYYEAAERRVRQELGVTLTGLEHVGKTTMMDKGCEKFITVFRAIHNGPFIYDRTVIAALRFEPVRQILELARAGRAKFTPTFEHVLKFVESLT